MSIVQQFQIFHPDDSNMMAKNDDIEELVDDNAVILAGVISQNKCTQANSQCWVWCEEGGEVFAVAVREEEGGEEGGEEGRGWSH